MTSATRFRIFALAFILATPTVPYAQTVGKVGSTQHSGHTIDAYGRPTLASDQSLVLTQDHPTSDGSTTIMAPGNGMQSYTVIYLDTRNFSSGGTLNIHIQIDPNSSTDGSFDLFPGNITIPTNGRPNGTLVGRYDIRRGTSTDLSYTFPSGQVFAFGLDGNWFSPKGATGKVDFRVSVKTQSDSKKSSSVAKVLPVIYGPAIDGNSVGVCIYLGARTSTSSITPATYNWVQYTETNIGFPDQAKRLDGTADKCQITNRWLLDPCNPDPGFEQSPFYRNGSAATQRFEGTSIQRMAWIDPDDQRPFDQLFLDLPSRSFMDALNHNTQLYFKARLSLVETDNQSFNSCPKKLGDGRDDATPMYCPMVEGITYGWEMKQIPYGADLQTVKGTVEFDVDPLMIGGQSFGGGRYLLVQRQGNRVFVPASGDALPKTLNTDGTTKDICLGHILKPRGLKVPILFPEPVLFQGQFQP